MHICKDFLLNNNCKEFNKYGKCSHHHSLSTEHNQKVLEKFHLSSQDQQTFAFVSRLIRIFSSITNKSTLFIQTLNDQHITENLIDQWLGEHKTLLIDKKLINPVTVKLTFDDDEGIR